MMRYDNNAENGHDYIQETRTRRNQCVALCRT
jgi:hypothetical protein